MSLSLPFDRRGFLKLSPGSPGLLLSASSWRSKPRRLAGRRNR